MSRTEKPEPYLNSDVQPYLNSDVEGLQACLVAQLVKNPPAMRETWVRSLGCEDLLEESMATHSSILA